MENTENPYCGKEWVCLKSDKSVRFKISISNPNGILEYYLKNSHERHRIHHSLVEPVDPKLIGELEMALNDENSPFNRDE